MIEEPYFSDQSDDEYEPKVPDSSISIKSIDNDLTYVSHFIDEPMIEPTSLLLLNDDPTNRTDSSILQNQSSVNVLIDEDSDSSSESDQEEDAQTDELQFQTSPEDEFDEDGGKISILPPKTKNETEKVIESVPIVKFDCSNLMIVGEVLYRIDSENTIVIQSILQSNDLPYALEEGSILCDEIGQPLGRIHELFGPISSPFYIVKWDPRHSDSESPGEGPSSQAVLRSLPGSPVFSPRDGPLVKLLPLTPSSLRPLRAKGSDASNAFDEEVGEGEEDFSDDEQEQAAKQRRKREKGGRKEGEEEERGGREGQRGGEREGGGRERDVRRERPNERVGGGGGGGGGGWGRDRDRGRGGESERGRETDRRGERERGWERDRRGESERAPREREERAWDRRQERKNTEVHIPFPPPPSAPPPHSSEPLVYPYPFHPSSLSPPPPPPPLPPPPPQPPSSYPSPSSFPSYPYPYPYPPSSSYPFPYSPHPLHTFPYQSPPPPSFPSPSLPFPSPSSFPSPSPSSQTLEDKVRGLEDELRRAREERDRAMYPPPPPPPPQDPYRGYMGSTSLR